MTNHPGVGRLSHLYSIAEVVPNPSVANAVSTALSNTDGLNLPMVVIYQDQVVATTEGLLLGTPLTDSDTSVADLRSEIPDLGYMTDPQFLSLLIITLVKQLAAGTEVALSWLVDLIRCRDVEGVLVEQIIAAADRYLKIVAVVTVDEEGWQIAVCAR